MSSDLAAVFRRRVALPFFRRFAPVRVVPANGRQLFADLRDAIIGLILDLDGSYQRALNEVVLALGAHLNWYWTLDIGANIGLHCLALSEAVARDGRVLAFEPEPHNGELIRALSRRCRRAT